MPDRYFVFLEGSKGPQAQIWYGMPTDGDGKPSINTLFEYKLTDGECQLMDCGFLTLDNLAFRFKHHVNTA